MSEFKVIFLVGFGFFVGLFGLYLLMHVFTGLACVAVDAEGRREIWTPYSPLILKSSQSSGYKTTHGGLRNRSITEPGVSLAYMVPTTLHPLDLSDDQLIAEMAHPIRHLLCY